MTATEQLAKYRSRHVIRPIYGLDTGHDYCETCDIRVHERRSVGRWLYRHDAAEIKRLVKAASRG